MTLYSCIPLEHSTNWNYNTSLTASNIIDSNWHFFAVTVDRSQGGNNQNLVYVDGVLSAGGQPSNQDIDNSGNYASLPLYIGSRAGSAHFFNGNIAHVLIYKRVLTPAEMQQNFNALKARYGL